jgi:RNA-directed DNA polymerase
VLANVALHVLDAAWAQTSSRLGVLVRYADDLVVLCTSRSGAEEALWRATAILQPLGLEMHPDTTRIVCLIRGQQGFDFLGFHHRKVESCRCVAATTCNAGHRTER